MEKLTIEEINNRLNTYDMNDAIEFYKTELTKANNDKIILSAQVKSLQKLINELTIELNKEANDVEDSE